MKISEIFKDFFATLGVLLCIAAIAIGVRYYLAYTADSVNCFKPEDCAFILNAGGKNAIGEDALIAVNSSLRAEKPNGAFEEIAVIKLKKIPLESITKPSDFSGDKWYSGDKLPDVLEDAAEFIMLSERISKLFDGSSLKSERYYIFPYAITMKSSLGVDSARLIIYDSETSELYYAGLKL